MYLAVNSAVTVNINAPSNTSDKSGCLMGYGAVDILGELDTNNTYLDNAIPYGTRTTFDFSNNGIQISPNCGYHYFIYFSGFNTRYTSPFITSFTCSSKLFSPNNNVSHYAANSLKPPDYFNSIFNKNLQRFSGIIMIQNVGPIYYEINPNNTKVDPSKILKLQYEDNSFYLVNIGNIDFDSSTSTYTVNIDTTNAILNQNGTGSNNNDPINVFDTTTYYYQVSSFLFFPNESYTEGSGSIPTTSSITTAGSIPTKTSITTAGSYLPTTSSITTAGSIPTTSSITTAGSYLPTTTSITTAGSYLPTTSAGSYLPTTTSITTAGSIPTTSSITTAGSIPTTSAGSYLPTTSSITTVGSIPTTSAGSYLPTTSSITTPTGSYLPTTSSITAGSYLPTTSSITAGSYLPTTASLQTTQPLTTRPQTTQPLTTQPLTTQPLTTQPLTTQPLTTRPQTTQPLTTQPLTTRPQTTQPLTTQPLTTRPQTTQPLTTRPQTTQPLRKKIL
jgi:hypothetical protein